MKTIHEEMDEKIIEKAGELRGFAMRGDQSLRDEIRELKKAVRSLEERHSKEISRLEERLTKMQYAEITANIEAATARFKSAEVRFTSAGKE